jgi:hypothetical protein
MQSLKGRQSCGCAASRGQNFPRGQINGAASPPGQKDPSGHKKTSAELMRPPSLTAGKRWLPTAGVSSSLSEQEHDQAEVALPAALRRETIEQLGGLPRLLPSAKRQLGFVGSKLIDALMLLAVNTVALQSFEEVEEEEDEGVQQRAVL